MLQNMKKLFSDALVGKKTIVFILSMILLVGVGSFMAYELTKTSVTLVIEGEERSQKTHAKTVDELMLENNIVVGEHDYIEPSLDSKLTDNLSVEWLSAQLVFFTKDGEKGPAWTTANTVEDFLEELNLEIREYDEITPSLDSALVEDMQITFESAFAVTLLSDNIEKEVWTVSTTVADFLAREKVILGELDRVEPTNEKIVKANTDINVIRVEKVTDVVEEATNFATVTKNDNSLTSGTEQEVQQGQKGKVAKHYQVIYENGDEVSRELLKTELVSDSKDRIVAVGTKQPTPTVSRSVAPAKSEPAKSTPAKSEPAKSAPSTVSASGEWRSFTSTAYTAYCNGCSGITRTGINLIENPNQRVVAVDPNVIPLGSIVEVRYNGTIMGQYKAADTGGAIVNNKIDIFMAERSDALRWGRKNVQVRIVK
ncbi:ubiquitin-like domain-containing protein [Bacillaceae bacterium IKA-2]|nr:ubiquitin-like domain-containing protein [Bacillaceae bacterium IKA-2]